jgi:hypothetical protein
MPVSVRRLLLDCHGALLLIAGSAPLFAASLVSAGQSGPGWLNSAPALDTTLAAATEQDAFDDTKAIARFPWRLDVYWENDGTILKPNNPQDRHYTNGAAAAFSFHPDLADRLHEHMPFGDDFDSVQTAAGIVLGHQMYTPRRITEPDPIEDDWPYSAYLYGGVFWQRADDHTFDHVELNLGAIGPVALGKPLQNIIHKVTADRDPAGWDNQLDNEPTAQLLLRRHWRLNVHELWRDPNAIDRPSAVGVQVLPNARLALGTVHRYVEGGVMLRVGLNLPDDFGPGEVEALASATGRPQKGLGCYGFASASGRLVQHNLFLEGNTFESSQSVDAKPVTGRVRAGIAVQYRTEQWIAETAWSQTFKSKEFEEQTAGDAFGQLRISMSARF